MKQRFEHSLHLKYRLLAVFLLLLLASFFSCVQDTAVRKKQMEGFRNLGVEYYYQRKYPEALSELLKAEKIYAKDADLQNTLGLTYMEMGRNELAIKHFKTAIKLRPDYSMAKNNLGVVYLNKKEWDKAIIYFEEVTKDLLYKTPHYPLVNLGWVYYNKKDYNLSEQYYLKALDFRPTYDDALYGLGRTYLAMEKIPEAVKRFETAVRISPRRPRFYFDLAAAYVEAEEFDKAAEAYKKVIDLVPGTPLAEEAAKARERLEKEN